MRFLRGFSDMNKTTASPPPNMLDYDQTCRAFRLEAPEYFNFGFDTVDPWAQDPAKLALLAVDDSGQEQRLTFAQVSEQSDRVAAALLRLGLQKGDRVLLIMGRIP